MIHEDLEAAGGVLGRLRNLEQWREDAAAVTPGSPILNLQGLSAERVAQIKSIALALYDAEIAGVRAKVAFLGLEAA